MELKAPWLKFYGRIRQNLSYPDATISEVVFSMARKHPKNTALVYMGRRISYGELEKKILKVRKMLETSGVKEGDRVMACLPNIPQAVYLLYGADSLGAVCSFVHPLSAKAELKKYIEELDAVCVVCLDSMEEKFSEVMSHMGSRRLILTNVADDMGFLHKLFKRKSKAKSKNILLWNRGILGKSESGPEKTGKKADDTAVILFSGGTTGEAKGVMISAKGLNAMAMQTAEMSGCDILGKSMLAVMPIFHGFGLCVCVHAVLMHGGTSILVPRFKAKNCAVLIRRLRPDFIAGVPTFFEALLKEVRMNGVDLSHLSGVFCGGDALPEKLRERFDSFLEEHGSKVKIREGYGATECVTASCLTPISTHRKGSVGIPFPDTYYKICRVDTDEELPYGTEGEICICGPALMKGYLNSKDETEKALRYHRDGHLWLHTGDGGVMDRDGFVYFRRRLGRMIITSGYNVYPEQLEQLLDAHPKVSRSCVVGVKDSYKMHRIKAYIIPKNSAFSEERLRCELIRYCQNNVAKYSIPSELEFVREFPLTKFGKIAYTQLQSS